MLLPLILAAYFAATASANASATILSPAMVKVEIEGEAVRLTEVGALAPEHRVVVVKDATTRTCTITYVNY